MWRFDNIASMVEYCTESVTEDLSSYEYADYFQKHGTSEQRVYEL